MAVTIKDIAAAADVSAMSVSRALRGTGRLGEDTRRRILRVAREMGYRPNLAAQATSTGRFQTVALLAAADRQRSYLSVELLEGIQQALDAHGYVLTLARVGDEQLSQDGQMPTLLQRSASDGMLINYQHHIPPSLVRQIRRYRLPSVWINSRQRSDCVFLEDADAAQRATRWMIEHGAVRPVYADFSHVTDDLTRHHYSVADRLAGYRQAMAQAGLEPRVIMADHSKYDAQQRERIATTLLEAPTGDRPDAVLCYSDTTLRPFLMAAVARNLDLDGELFLSSFDTSEACDWHRAVLRICQPDQRMGREAVDMLTERIASPHRRQPPRGIPATLLRWGLPIDHPASVTAPS